MATITNVTAGSIEPCPGSPQPLANLSGSPDAVDERNPRKDHDERSDRDHEDPAMQVRQGIEVPQRIDEEWIGADELSHR